MLNHTATSCNTPQHTAIDYPCWSPLTWVSVVCLFFPQPGINCKILSHSLLPVGHVVSRGHLNARTARLLCTQHTHTHKTCTQTQTQTQTRTQSSTHTHTHPPPSHTMLAAHACCVFSTHANKHIHTDAQTHPLPSHTMLIPHAFLIFDTHTYTRARAHTYAHTFPFQNCMHTPLIPKVWHLSHYHRHTMARWHARQERCRQKRRVQRASEVHYQCALKRCVLRAWKDTVCGETARRLRADKAAWMWLNRSSKKIMSSWALYVAKRREKRRRQVLALQE